MILYGLAVVTSTAIAGLLLRSSPVGKVSWKGFVAGGLLPWSLLLGSGSLTALLIRNAVTGVLVGGAVIALDQFQPLEELWLGGANGTARRGWLEGAVTLATFVCWGILLLLWWLTILAQWRNTSSGSSASGKSRRAGPLLIGPVAAVILSWSLRLGGYPWWALCVVSVPLILLLAPAFVLFLVIAGHYVAGKPIRWN